MKRDGQVIVRDASVGDAAAIAAIRRVVVEGSAATFSTHVPDAEETARDITVLQAEGRAFLVAEMGGRVVGLAFYRQFRGGPGYIHTMEHTIQLAPDARGHGIGVALMAALEAHAATAGVHTMVAGISGENPAGIAFHAALGYVETGRMPEVGRKFGRWMDLVLLQKRLGKPGDGS